MAVKVRSTFAILVGALLVALTSGCMSLRQGQLLEDGGGTAFLTEAYGGISRSALYFSFEQDFADSMRLYREGVLSDTQLSQAEKEQRFADLKDFTFVEDGYLVYFFRLRAPALVKMNEFGFTFNDKSGNSIISKILPTSNKVSISYGGETAHSYNYGWYMQLRAPFTTANYPAGEYLVEITYPNGAKSVYTLVNR